jgi:hypothetical protein
MSFRQSRLSDLDVARAIHHNESLRQPVREDDDFDVLSLFPEPKPKHSWEVIESGNRMLRKGTLSKCRHCGIERDHYMHFGQWFTKFKIAGAWVESKTPTCEEGSL